VKDGQRNSRCMAAYCFRSNEAGQGRLSFKDRSAKSSAERPWVTVEGDMHGRRCGSGVCCVLCAVASVAFEHLKIGYMQTFRRLQGQHRRMKIRSYNILCAFCSLSWVSYRILPASPCIQQRAILSRMCSFCFQSKTTCCTPSVASPLPQPEIASQNLPHAQVPSSSRVA